MLQSKSRTPFVLFQNHRAIHLVWKIQCPTTETRRHGEKPLVTLWLSVSGVRSGLSGLPGLILNLQKVSEGVVVANSRSNDPLHGITLEMIVTRLVDRYGWAELGKHIPIKCFTDNPSIKSSLKFLRRTPWARKKVEDLYLRSIA